MAQIITIYADDAGIIAPVYFNCDSDLFDTVGESLNVSG